jgi:hypothetical protein
VRRGRKCNDLTKLLLSDESAKQEFIELMNRLNCSMDVWDHIRKNGFRGVRFYYGYQTICILIRRLGFKAMRGRKATRPYVVATTGSRFSKR